MWSYALGFFVMCGLIDFGTSIMCYECNSAQNSQCSAQTLPETLKRNCSEHDRGIKHTLCRKIVQHVDYGVNGLLPQSRVIRTCGWDETKYKGACYHRAGYGGRQEVCSCSKDLCNGADLLTASTLVAILTLAMMLVQAHLCG